MRVVLIFGVLLFPVSVFAWSLIEKIDEKSFYVDLQSAQKTSFGYQMKIMTDYPQKQGELGYRSLVSDVEFDCVKPRMRNIYGRAFLNNMASGAIVDSGVYDQEWIVTKSGSLGHLQRSLLCHE